MNETKYVIEQSDIKDCYVPDNNKLPLYGPLHIKDHGEFFQEEATKFLASYTSPFPHRLSIDNFDILYQIGSGAFGVVALVRYSRFESYYAMKALKKKNIVKKNYLQKALNEKLMLQSLNCPFTIYLLFFSQDNTHIYFILPFVYGGEIYTWLKKLFRFSENLSKFYAAQIVLAFEYLHRCSVAYRDLKPENVLLDHYGFVKVTDFGLAKVINRRTYTFCGTPDYIAPEIVLCKGYSKAVDWWTLGVFIFEISTGRTPFDGPNEQSTFENITAVRYTMPKYLKEDIRDLIGNLLQINLTKRMGNLKAGVEDIKNHPWFKEIDWLALLNRSVIPPFVPTNAKQINKVVFPAMKKMPDTEILVEDKYKEAFKDF